MKSVRPILAATAIHLRVLAFPFVFGDRSLESYSRIIRRRWRSARY